MQNETTRYARQWRTTTLIGAVFLTGLLGSSGAARADVSAENKAAAEMLFRQGKDLMAKKSFAQACEKLANSQQMDPAAGTLLNLGDCYEKVGRLASAWATFKEAAASAKLGGQAGREAAAKGRAAALEPRLPLLVVNVAAESADVAEVKRDGAPVVKGVWGTPLPVDPGDHLIEASAPGKIPWSQRVTATETKTVNVDVPVLVAEGAAPAPPQAPPQAATSGGGGLGGQKIGALILGGAGVVALGVAGAVTLASKSKYNAADCQAADGCSQTGYDDRTSAVSTARSMTIVSAVGGIAIAAGAVLWLTAPASKDAKVGLAPVAGPQTAGLSIRGAW